MTTKFYYRTRWSCDLWCPLGEVKTRPFVRVSAIGSKTIPFREIDLMTDHITSGTYEEAATELASWIKTIYGGTIRVRVGERGLWAQAEV